MSKQTAWFRSSDGIDMAAEEGSASFELMEKTASFTRIDGPDCDRIEEPTSPDDGPTDLSKLSKKQLFETAAALDVPVTEKMTKDQIIEAINAKGGE